METEKQNGYLMEFYKLRDGEKVKAKEFGIFISEENFEKAKPNLGEYAERGFSLLKEAIEDGDQEHLSS